MMIAVAHSRMYLGVPYPSDILADTITGAGSAWLTYKINKWMHGKNPCFNCTV